MGAIRFAALLAVLPASCIGREDDGESPVHDTDADPDVDTGPFEECDADVDADADVDTPWPEDLAGADVRIGAGNLVAMVGDTNCDGYDDLLVAAGLYWDDALVFLVEGPVSKDLDDMREATARLIMENPWPIGYPPVAVAGAGDVDGDGRQDLLIAVSDENRPDSASGLISLVLSPVRGDVDLGEQADARIYGPDGSHAGTSVTSAGDIDGNGLDDVIVGSDFYNSAWLVLSPMGGDISLKSLGVELRGGEGGGWRDREDFGCDVDGGQDVNGDGVSDLLIGAPCSDRGSEGCGGAAYLFLGPVTAAMAADDADSILVGAGDGGALGGSVALAGDVDGEGRSDILLGAARALEDDRGIGFLFCGPDAGVHTTEEATGSLEGTSASDLASFAVAGAGDVNADGFADLLVSAPYHDAGGSYEYSSGSVYLVRGPVEGHHTLDVISAHEWEGEYEWGFAGSSLDGGGDVNADGFADVILGSCDADGDCWDSFSYLVLGRPD